MNRKDVYLTNLTIMLGFAALFYFTRVSWFLLPAIVVLVCSLVSFSAAKKIAAAWMLVGKTIGGFNARILLSVLFILLVTPIGLLRKLFQKKSAPVSSNWKPAANTPFDFNRPF